jgi:hypothetical protein
MMPVRTYSTPPIRAASPPHRKRFEDVIALSLVAFTRE